MTMNNDDSDWLREQMARVRSHLANDVGEVVEQAKELTDWRSHVRRHPWLFAGAAAAIGFMIVPARRRRGDFSAEANGVRAVLGKEAHEMSTASRTKSALHPLLNAAAGSVMRSLMTMAGHQIQNMLVSRAHPGPHPTTDSWQSPPHPR
jgi:hypothetical protein